MSKVSIVIPVYGVEKYIERCARSLFEQTLDDIEYLFIDDCSPDNSIAILKRVLKDYPMRELQVIIHRMKHNSGQAAVRKWGITNAKGNYIIHCDSDDWMELNMCETLYVKAANEGADMIFCDYYINSPKEEKIFERSSVDYSKKEDVFRYALVRDWLCPVWGVLVKKEIYNRVEFPTGDQSEDKTYVIQLIYYSKTISRCSKALYHYRINPHSISHTKELETIIKRYFDIEKNRNIIKRFSERNGLINQYPLEYQAYFFLAKFILNHYLSNKDCRKLWESSYPSSNRNVWLNPYVKTTDKVKFAILKIWMLLK